jgi:hypothetical protein
MDHMKEHQSLEFLRSYVPDLSSRDAQYPVKIWGPLHNRVQVEIRRDGIELRLRMLRGRHRGDCARAPLVKIETLFENGKPEQLKPNLSYMAAQRRSELRCSGVGGTRYAARIATGVLTKARLDESGGELAIERNLVGQS